MDTETNGDPEGHGCNILIGVRVLLHITKKRDERRELKWNLYHTYKSVKEQIIKVPFIFNSHLSPMEIKPSYYVMPWRSGLSV